MSKWRKRFAHMDSLSLWHLEILHDSNMKTKSPYIQSFAIFRTQGVQRLDGRLAYPSAIRLMYADDLADKFEELRNVDGSQVRDRIK